MAKLDIKGNIINDDNAWIYDWLGIDCTCPKKVHKAISEAKSRAEPLDVYINSPGGSVFAGSEIYSALRDFENVNIHIVGMAGSAASIIACAGKSDISPTAIMMIHCSQISVEGNHNDMKAAENVLQTVDDAIVNAYIEKTGRDKAELLDMMNVETWMNADDAVAKGFVDEISKPKVAIQNIAASAGFMISDEVIEKMKNVRNKAHMELELLNLKGSIKND